LKTLAFISLSDDFFSSIVVYRLHVNQSPMK